MMYKNILVPIAADHDPHTAEALSVARLLLDGDGQITTLTVVEAVPDFIVQQLPEGQIDVTTQEVVKAMENSLKNEDSVRVVVVTGHSGRTILDWAGENSVDCIVMASHRPGLSDYFLGSTASRVVRHAQCAVHVLR